MKTTTLAHAFAFFGAYLPVHSTPARTDRRRTNHETSLRAIAICPTCFMALPAIGICETCT